MWPIPFILFWAVSAVYFGGLERDVQGGSGFRQFIGLIVALVLFLAVWGVVRAFVLKDSALGVLVACLLAIALYPLLIRVGVLVTGGRITRSGGGH